eukprot:sb/3475314/
MCDGKCALFTCEDEAICDGTTFGYYCAYSIGTGQTSTEGEPCSEEGLTPKGLLESETRGVQDKLYAHQHHATLPHVLQNGTRISALTGCVTVGLIVGTGEMRWDVSWMIHGPVRSSEADLISNHVKCE